MRSLAARPERARQEIVMSITTYTMKTMTCTCGHQEMGTTDQDVTSKMESHIANEHSDDVRGTKRLLEKAKQTVAEELHT